MLGPKLFGEDYKESNWKKAEEIRDYKRKNTLLKDRNASSISEKKPDDKPYMNGQDNSLKILSQDESKMKNKSGEIKFEKLEYE